MSGVRSALRTSACLALALAAATVTAAGNAPSGPFSEPRNAATGFAVTLWMAVEDTLGQHCGAQAGEAGTRSRAALAQWQGRNQALVETAFVYMLSMEEAIEASAGEHARRSFRDERKQEFMASARDLQTAWFPGAKIDDARCLQLAAQVDEGHYDIARTPEFHTTLQRMAAGAGD